MSKRNLNLNNKFLSNNPVYDYCHNKKKEKFQVFLLYIIVKGKETEKQPSNKNDYEFDFQSLNFILITIAILVTQKRK